MTTLDQEQGKRIAKFLRESRQGTGTFVTIHCTSDNYYETLFELCRVAQLVGANVMHNGRQISIIDYRYYITHWLKNEGLKSTWIASAILFTNS